MGNDLPFNPDEYLRDGVRPGSPTERHILRVNCRWGSQCGKPCPLTHHCPAMHHQTNTNDLTLSQLGGGGIASTSPNTEGRQTTPPPCVPPAGQLDPAPVLGHFVRALP